MTEAQEKLIFEAIEKNDPSLLRRALVDSQDVNIFDENLMTPLQHASYKGNKELVQLLLDRGANVNICQHQHSYTSLHFAGLSGNVEVCSILLAAGANPNAVNSVGRTPSQMAAFVGNHGCVSIINNFIPKSVIVYYTVLQGQQTTPYLPPFLVESFHKFAMQVNVHPVRIALNLQRFVGLFEHLDEVRKVLELMSEKEMSSKGESNEIMSFKFHYLKCIVAEMAKMESMHKKENVSENATEALTRNTVELFTRKLLKPSKDGALEFMEQYIRECVRAFPYRECVLFRQIVSSLASKGSSALSIIAAAINGQKGFIDNMPMCNTCGEEKPGKKCSKCKVVQYCDRECQRLHWFVHKKSCVRLSSQSSIASKPDPHEITADMQSLLVN